jgi:hypothetical protein
MQRDRSIGSRGEGGDRVALLQQLAACMNCIMLFSTLRGCDSKQEIYLELSFCPGGGYWLGLGGVHVHTCCMLTLRRRKWPPAVRCRGMRRLGRFTRKVLVFA